MSTNLPSTRDWMDKLVRQARAIFNAVDWQDGKWYAVYDADCESPADARLFECVLADDEVYLLADQPACDSWADRETWVAMDLITSHTVVVPQ